MQIEPLGTNVALAVEESTANSSTILVSTKKESLKVVALGEDAGSELKVGMRAVCAKGAGTKVVLDGVKYLLADARDIIAYYE